MDAERTYKFMKEHLGSNEYFKTPRNNKLVLEFHKAKLNGGYKRLVFEKKANSEKTLIKKAMNLRKFEQYFNKDFDKITESELLEYRDMLNKDKVKADKTLIHYDPKTKKHSFKIVETKRPLSYRTKIDYRSNFNEFYRFIMEYIFQETGKELPDITRYFKIQKPSDFQEVVVDFIPDDERQTLLANIRNRNFKAYVQQALMSGARPCEMQEIRYGKKYNLYKNQKGEWIIKLPKVKGVSYAKFPFIIDMFEDELIPYYESLKLKEGDYVFDLTDATVRKLMQHYTSKYLGKAYSPKILRKTARMIRTNAGYSEQWINKLMGHAPGSRVIGHYINHDGIKNEPIANEKLKAQQYPSLKRDYEKMQLQLKAQQQQMAQMLADIQKIKGEEGLAELKQAREIKRGGKK